jgi:hypothetical protein
MLGAIASSPGTRQLSATTTVDEAPEIAHALGARPSVSIEES